MTARDYPLVCVKLLLIPALIAGGCVQPPPVGQRQAAISITPAVPLSPNQLSLDLGGEVSLIVAAIGPGRFKIGGPDDPSEYQRNVAADHAVTITAGFWLGIHEVTIEQFTAFVNATHYITDAEKQGFTYGYVGGVFRTHSGFSWRNSGFKQGLNHPVVNVSWNDASAFCAWLAKRSGKRVRLPTEAEWEYACRAGSTTEYPWGNNPAGSKEYGNVFDQSALRQIPEGLHEPSPQSQPTWDDGHVYTAPVGQFRPNFFALHDMVGNCAEWCEDYYGPYSAGAAGDPRGPASGTDHVIRGGSWKDRVEYCRSASRSFGAPEDACDWVGFRVCVESAR